MRRESSVRTVAAIVLSVSLGLIAASGIAAAPPAQGQTSVPADPVDLNVATVDALVAIPGIGEVMAQRIVDWREENGPFRRVEDLMKVKGVGEKTFDKLRPYVKVGKSR